MKLPALFTFLCRTSLCALLSVVMLLVLAMPSFAALETQSRNIERHENKSGWFFAPKQSGASSAGEAAQIAKSQYGGKVLKVSTHKTENGVQYRVRLLLDNGRIKIVVIAGN